MISPIEFESRTIGRKLDAARKLVKEELGYDLLIVKQDGQVVNGGKALAYRKEMALVEVEKGVITKWHGIC